MEQKKSITKGDNNRLRKKAEKLLSKGGKTKKKVSAKDIKKLSHKLRVHQAEEKLPKYKSHLESLVKERTAGMRTNNEILQKENIELKQQEELHKLNRTLRALSNSSQALMHATDEAEYLQEVCRIIVRDCGHSMVWIGFAEEDEAKTVRPVAYAGFEESYLKTLKITWADTERGRGPTGSAIRTSGVCVCRDMLTDPDFLPWREQAMRRGYASSIALPLLTDGNAFGALTIYSPKPDSFSEDELQLLTELANDLAYGITVIRLRQAQKQAEDALRQSRDELEMRVKERTAQLTETVNELQSEASRRLLAEKALIAERQRLYDVLETLPAYVVLLTPDYHVPFANRFFRERFGESNGKRCYEYLFNRTEPCEICETYSVMKTKKPHRWEWTGPDGRNYDIYDYLFTDVNGSPLIMEMGIDITERKNAEQKLQKSERKYRMLIEQASDGIATLDRKLNIIDVNPMACQMTGFSKEELLRLNAKALIPREDLVEIFLLLDKVLAGETVVTERRLIRKDGSILNVDASAKMLEDGRLQTIFRDITGRKEEDNLKHITNVLLELFTKTSSRKEYLDSVVQVLRDWSGCRCVGIRVVNDQGYIPYESFVGFSKDFWRLENMLLLKKDICACVRVITGKPEIQDTRALTSYGSFRLDNSIEFLHNLTEEEKTRYRGNCIRSGFISIALVPVRYRGQTLGAIHLADEKEGMASLKAVQFIETMSPLIGEAVHRFNVEEELRGSEASLLEAQRIAGMGNWDWNIQTNGLKWSDEIYRIFGLTPQQFGATYDAFLNHVHPEDREFVKDAVNEALYGGKSYSIDHRIILPDGTERIVHEQAEVTFSESGEPVRMFGTVLDITERKRAEEELNKYREHLEELVQTRTEELRQLSEELRRSNADLQQFAYAASHDLQEPLRGVEGFVKLLEKRYKGNLDTKADEFIEYIVDGVKRMQALIKDLLEYSQVGAKGKRFKPVDSSLVVGLAVGNLKAAIEESGAIVTYDDLPTVMGDFSQLSRLFQNLIGNAIKFHREELLGVHVSAELKGNEWVFSVRDNGIGMDPKSAERIFIIFQRLHSKEEYPGTGIGLAICKKIVERHGGRIWAESEPGKGSTFYFSLPVFK
jgi:PAS domain S-box-containing protein